MDEELENRFSPVGVETEALGFFPFFRLSDGTFGDALSNEDAGASRRRAVSPRPRYVGGHRGRARRRFSRVRHPRPRRDWEDLGDEDVLLLIDRQPSGTPTGSDAGTLG